jgi:hypothetical protein
VTVRTARELRNRVAAKFGRTSDPMLFPEHVVLYEVPLHGRGNSRSLQRIDAVAVGVWPGTQQLIHGFELKVSRADLLHELKDLTKSQAAVDACDRFWLVLGDAKLLRPEDPVPESWGILAASGRGLRTLRAAEPQAGRHDPSLIIGLVTRALVAPRMGFEARYKAGLQRGRTEGREENKFAFDALRRRYEDLQIRAGERAAI